MTVADDLGPIIARSFALSARSAVLFEGFVVVVSGSESHPSPLALNFYILLLIIVHVSIAWTIINKWNVEQI